MRVNRTVITMIVAMVAMIGMTGFAAATYDSSVILENKDINWDVVVDGVNATIDYKYASSEFEWHAYGTAAVGSNYSLIYYADKPDRFNEWGGNNPGAFIGYIVTEASGSFNVSGSTELGMSMPHPNDWNIAPDPDYCDYHNGYDDYDHCTGAKLWMVPTNSLPDPYPGDGEWAFWNTGGILFETDLIEYIDCDEYLDPQAAPENATFFIGDVFNYSVASVPIMVLNATNVGAVQVTLEYDASVLNFESVSKGDMDNMGQPNNGIDNGT